MHMICSRPDLFKVMTPIKVDVLAALLVDHPNHLYIESVLWSMCHGFWPWATCGEELYPDQWDNSEWP